MLGLLLYIPLIILWTQLLLARESTGTSPNTVLIPTALSLVESEDSCGQFVEKNASSYFSFFWSPPPTRNNAGERCEAKAASFELFHSKTLSGRSSNASMLNEINAGDTCAIGRVVSMTAVAVASCGGKGAARAVTYSQQSIGVCCNRHTKMTLFMIIFLLTNHRFQFLLARDWK